MQRKDSDSELEQRALENIEGYNSILEALGRLRTNFKLKQRAVERHERNATERLYVSQRSESLELQIHQRETMLNT